MIPKLHYISKGDSAQEHLDNIQSACSSGAELIQLCADISSEKKLLKLAQDARNITSHFQTRLIINGNYKIAKSIKADGVHLEQTHACPTLVRKELYSWQIIGATAHTVQDCEDLITKEVDYISLSPFRTTKETSVQALGLNGYQAIIESINTQTPVLGSGGITIDDVSAILKTGISGLLVSEDITRNFNLIKTYHDLLKASSTEEQRYKL